MKLIILYFLQTAKCVLQNNIKFARACREVQNITLFKSRFVVERAKPCLTEPEKFYRSSVFIHEPDVLYRHHFNVIRAADHKENIINIFLGKCL